MTLEQDNVKEKKLKKRILQAVEVIGQLLTGRSSASNKKSPVAAVEMGGVRTAESRLDIKTKANERRNKKCP